MKHLSLIALLIIMLPSFSQVAINIDGSTANSSAMLDIKSTEKGVLIPRLTSSQRDAINDPAQGLMVFVTSDSTYHFYDGSSWKKLGIGSSGWDYYNGELFSDSLQSVSIGDTAGSATFQVITDLPTDTYTSDKCSGGTASASESYAGKSATNAFDNSTTTYWSNDNNLPVWLQYDLGSGNGKVIARYRIYFESANYDASPANWTFQASDNASSWTTLDTRTGENWSANEWKEYTFSNSERYRYYRINISDNKGTTDSYVSINEMEMLEMIYENHPTLVVVDNKVGIGTSTPSAILEVAGRISQTNTGLSVFLGEEAGLNDENWYTQNAFLGYKAGYTNTTGKSNVAIGYQPLYSNTYGLGNIAIGHETLFSNTTASYNNAIGYRALRSNTKGSNNIAIGLDALYFNITGSCNIAIGDRALESNMTGFSNVAIGTRSLFNNSTISNLVAIGDSALYNNGTGATGDEGTCNTALGSKSMFSNTTGALNVSVGYQASYSGITATRNCAIGYKALYSNTSGDYNVALGDRALMNFTGGRRNTAIGCGVLENNVSGERNTSVGAFSMYSATSGDDNVAVGKDALMNNSGNYNVAVGSGTMYDNTTGDNNTSVGTWSMGSNTTGQSNSAFGSSALTSNTTGYHNTGIGVLSLKLNTTGVNNTATGDSSLYSNVSGNENCAFGARTLRNNTGSYNVVMGMRAGYSNTSGEANVGIGPNAMYYNITGSGNTAIGSWAGPASGSTALTNTTALGAYASVTTSNTIHIGNTSITEIAGQVAWSTYSDARFKKNIKGNVPGLDFILQLKPVTYNWDIEKLDKFLKIENPDKQSCKNQEQNSYSGFLAQEVEETAYKLGYDFSGVVAPQNENSIYSIRYAEFVVPLVKAVQEQQVIINNQQQVIDGLIWRLEKLEQDSE